MVKHKNKIQKKTVKNKTLIESDLIKEKPLNVNKLCLIVFFFAILLYGYTISFDFTLDDGLMITDNEFTKKGIHGLKEIFTNDAFAGLFGKGKILVAGGRYRPLTHAMFAIEYSLFGASPFVGHFINVILYALLGTIILKTLSLCFKNLPSEKEWFRYIPFTATLLFIAHPLHTEAVANIKGRDEIISMGGSMMALFYSLKYVDHRHYKYLVFSFISFIIGIFSKENTITFLAVVPLTLWFFTNAKAKDYLKTLIPLLTASAIFIIARYNALGFWFIGSHIQTEILNNPFIYSTKSEEIATVLYTWLIYLKLLFLPYPLTHDYYPWHISITDFSSPYVLLSFVIVIFLIAVALFRLRDKHFVSYGILFFTATFSIQSNLFFNMGTFMNERFVFVALLGFCIIIAFYFSKINIKQSKTFSVMLILLLSLYSIMTVSRSLAWKDNYTLFTTDVKTSKNSAKCNVSVAEMLISVAVEKSKTDSARAKQLFEDAYGYLQTAKKIHPKYKGVYDFGGKAAFHLKNYKTSFENYKEYLKLHKSAVIINNIYLVAIAAINDNQLNISEEILLWLISAFPDSLDYRMELVNVYEKTGKIDLCIQELENLLEEEPEYYKGYAKLGEIYGKILHNPQKAELYLLKAWLLKPDDFSINEKLGIVYGMQKKFRLSIDYFMRAMEIDSTVESLYSNIARTYLSMGMKDSVEIYIQKSETIKQRKN